MTMFMDMQFLKSDQWYLILLVYKKMKYPYSNFQKSRRTNFGKQKYFFQKLGVVNFLTMFRAQITFQKRIV